MTDSLYIEIEEEWARISQGRCAFLSGGPKPEHYDWYDILDYLWVNRALNEPGGPSDRRERLVAMAAHVIAAIRATKPGSTTEPGGT